MTPPPIPSCERLERIVQRGAGRPTRGSSFSGGRRKVRPLGKRRNSACGVFLVFGPGWFSARFFPLHLHCGTSVRKAESSAPGKTLPGRARARDARGPRRDIIGPTLVVCLSRARAAQSPSEGEGFARKVRGGSVKRFIHSAFPPSLLTRQSVCHGQAKEAGERGEHARVARRGRMSAAAQSAFDKQEEQQAIGDVLSGNAEAEGCVSLAPVPRVVFLLAGRNAIYLISPANLFSSPLHLFPPPPPPLNGRRRRAHVQDARRDCV